MTSLTNVEFQDGTIITADWLNGVNDFLNTILPGSTGSALVGYLQGDVGSVLTTVQEKLAQYVSVIDFGAVGDGVADDDVAIQTAIDSGRPLYFPAGIYIVRLNTAIALEGGATVCALKAKTRMILQGAGYSKTTIKVKDNQSTDASPKYWNLIASNEVLDGIIIDGITFDLNGQNNKISPNRGSGVYNKFNCAAFMVSGSVATVGVDALINDSRITHCKFTNSPGVTCIAVAQSNSVGSSLGNNVEIAHNYFYNNGIDTDDHSSVYMWGEGISVHHNTFGHPTMSNGIQGPYAAAELHGARNTFVLNQVYNYPWGVYIAGNLTAVAHDQKVLDNTFIVAKKAVIMYVETATEPGMRDVLISRNRVWLTGDFGAGAAKKCLDLVPSQGNVDGILVTDNFIYTTDTYGAYAISVGVLAVGKAVLNVKIHGNQIKGFSTPMSIGVSGGGTTFDVDASENQIIDVKPNTSTPTFTIGIYTAGTLGRIRIANNSINGASAGNPYFGIYLDTGAISDLAILGNVIDKAAVVAISDNATVSGSRYGEQATTFLAIPSQSTWKIGDVAYLAGKPQLGTSPNKYVVDGWTRVTNGTANVLNTDWYERRILTGN